VGKSLSLVYGSVKMANCQKRVYCEVKNSKHVIRFLRALRSNSIIYGYSQVAGTDKILVYLKYSRNRPTIRGFYIRSRSGHRRFLNLHSFRRDISRLRPSSFVVTSTNKHKGVSAVGGSMLYSLHRQHQVHFGEYLCIAW
jgi:ribosomal protein S8